MLPIHSVYPLVCYMMRFGNSCILNQRFKKKCTFINHFDRPHSPDLRWNVNDELMMSLLCLIVKYVSFTMYNHQSLSSGFGLLFGANMLNTLGLCVMGLYGHEASTVVGLCLIGSTQLCYQSQWLLCVEEWEMEGGKEAGEVSRFFWWKYCTFDRNTHNSVFWGWNINGMLHFCFVS